MNAVISSTVQHEYSSASQRAPQSTRPRLRHFWWRLLHPLTAICAAQTMLSLALVWSNTAFPDEADYLRIGHLEWAHWLHGTSWPSAYADQFLSGSPVIYPPLGALADSVGGVAGARILSLGFMLAATVLLYLTAARLLGRAGAVAAAALWVLSEPVIRLAFATYDPLSVMLTALSGWLIVQAGHRRGRGAFVAAAAAALALANATAYSGIVIDPVVIIFAFLVWLPRMHAPRALLRAASFVGIGMVFFGLVMTMSHSWAGIVLTVLHRSGSDRQSVQIVLKDIWSYSGLVASLAVIGVLTALGAEARQRSVLLGLLGCAAFIVPAAQLRDQTGWSLDKHLAYGIWFAAIAAGYGCSKLIRWLPESSRRLAAICCLIALIYPATSSWQSAWAVYHAWPNARSFVTAFAPVAARSRGSIYVSGQFFVAEYYTPQGRDWTRWTTSLSLDPLSAPPSDWESYYTTQLHHGNYGVIALFYPTTLSSAPELPGHFLVKSQRGDSTSQELLRIVGDNSGEPGLLALTLAIVDDPDYHRVAVGLYDSADEDSYYAIWQKVHT